MFCNFIALALVFTVAAPAIGAAAEADQQLAQLKHPEPEVRIAALRELHTTLDPRLPDAMRELLTDSGNSIRRLAARGIGSRWWQIPKDRIPIFVAALKRNEKSDFADEVSMVRRGIGLLTRDYRGPMFSRSANRRWVIYERRGLPCLIDTKTETEELLGATGEERSGWMSGSWGNDQIGGSAQWHPKEEIVALHVLTGRKSSEIWIWRHRAELVKLGFKAIVNTVGIREDDVLGGGGFFTELNGWKRGELRFNVSFATPADPKLDERLVEHTALLAWDFQKEALRVVSHRKQRE